MSDQSPFYELRPRPHKELSFLDVHVLGIRIKADKERLAALCHARAIAVDPESRFEPASDVLVLDIIRHGLSNQDDVWSTKPTRDVVLVRALVRDKSPGADEEPRMICLLALTNDPWFLVDGRELVGYPVQRGKVATQRSPEGRPIGMSVIVDGYSDNSSRLADQTIIEIFPSQQTNSGEVGSDAQSFPWKAAEVDGVFRDHGRIGTFHPRQCRDALDVSKAFFSAPMAGTFSYAAQPKRRDWVSFRGGNLVLRNCRSLRITDVLAQAPQGSEMKIALDDCYISLVDIVVRPDTSMRRLPPTQTALPKYVEFMGDPQGPPPYRFEQVKAFGFKMLAANPEKLRSYCEAVLNIDGDEQGFRYKVASDYVVIEILEYGRMRLARNAKRTHWQRESDYGTQNELVVRVLVGKVEDDSGTATEPKIFVPVIFVDDAWSVVCGREVIGYPKLLARFETTVGDPSRNTDTVPANMTCTKVSICRPFDPSSQEGLSDYALLTVTHPSQRENQQYSVGTNPLGPDHATGPFNWVQEDFDDPAFRRSFVGEWFEMRATRSRNVQLKQVRDWTEPQWSRRTQLLESESSIDRLSVNFPTGIAIVEFGAEYKVDSPSGRFRLFDALGITSTDRRRLDPPPTYSGVERRKSNDRRRPQDSSGDDVAHRSVMRLSTGDWYITEFDFSLRMIDPLRDHG